MTGNLDLDLELDDGDGDDGDDDDDNDILILVLTHCILTDFPVLIVNRRGIDNTTRTRRPLSLGSLGVFRVRRPTLRQTQT